MSKKRDKCFQGFHLSPKHHHNNSAIATTHTWAENAFKKK